MHPGLICFAVRDMLRNSFRNYAPLPLDPAVIEVMPDLKPPAYTGDTFISVYATDWSAVTDDTNVALDYQIGVSCTLTRRSPIYPQNQRGPELYARQFIGMGSICLRVMTALSHNISLFQTVANFEEYLSYRDEDPDPDLNLDIGQLYEFLRWQRTDPAPIPVYADHFSAENEHLQDPAGEAIMGYIMTVEFGKSRMGIRLDT